MEYRRELFRFAAARVRAAVRPATWQAFWRTSVLEEPVERVACDLEMTAGAVYIARCRVLQRLKELVQQWEHDDAF
jgi:RNA polymerase sigma-70 factor (ECF subfamily)